MAKPPVDGLKAAMAVFLSLILPNLLENDWYQYGELSFHAHVIMFPSVWDHRPSTKMVVSEGSAS